MSTLRSVRGMLRRYVLIQAALMVVCWVILLFWLGGLIDYLPVTLGSNETPRWVRAGLLAIMAAGAVWAIVFWALPRIFARIQNRSLALLIEKHFPQLENHLVTAVELSEHTEAADVSDVQAHRAMLARVHSQLEERIHAVQPSDLFNWQPIWGVGVATAFGLVVTGLAVLSAPQWMEFWAKRLFTLADNPWPRTAMLRADGVQLQLPAFTGQLSNERRVVPFLDGLVRVPQGAAVMLQISAESETKKVPDVCTLFYETDDGSRGRANLRRIGSPQNGWQQFAIDGPPLDGIADNMTLDVIGLDARLRDLQLEVVEPAVITNLRVECIYPQYLLESLSRPQSETLAYRNGMKVPEGTQIALVGEANCNLSLVQFSQKATSPAEPDSQTDDPDESSDEETGLVIHSVEPTENRFRIELGRISSSMVTEIRLFDAYGLASDSIPRYLLAVQRDTSPEVATRLKGIGNAVTENAIMPIVGTVEDDNGVASIFARVANDKNESIDLPIPPLSGIELETEIDLQKLAADGSFSVAAGDTLGIVVTATDFFDLNDQPHLGGGMPKQLSVVTEDELLVRLDREELELRQRLELIVVELEQLRQVIQMIATSQNAESAMHIADLKDFVSLQQDGTDEDAEAAAQRQRMLVFRAQQSVLQGDKSSQELAGVADRVENIRMQLQNNRIDSYDRQTRLQEKVHDPLASLLENEFQRLAGDLIEMQTAVMSAQGGKQANQSLGSLDAVLVKLYAIKESMLDIEDFNEIIDLVRGLLEDQDKILQATEEAQRAKILELLGQ